MNDQAFDFDGAGRKVLTKMASAGAINAPRFVKEAMIDTVDYLFVAEKKKADGLPIVKEVRSRFRALRFAPRKLLRDEQQKILKTP